MKRFNFVILATLLVAPVFAWGPEGHRVVAEIAYHYMNKKAIEGVDNVLGKHGLVYWTNWADEIRSDTIYPNSYDWHFQDLEEGMSEMALIDALTNYPKEGGKIFRAMDSLTLVLMDDNTNRDALRFIIHLSGDRYCPVHMGHISDKGGNTIKTKWFNQPTNMHRIWDEHLIDFRGYSYTEYAQMLIDVYGDSKTKVDIMTPEELLLRNYSIVSAIYEYQKTWNGNAYNYAYRWKNTLDEQLFIAGVRLAKLLNELYR